MKFINLLKKELGELINKQMILSLVVVMAIFMLIGNIMENVIDDAVTESYTINLSDRDQSDTSKELVESLKKCGITVYECTSDSDDYSKVLSDNEVQSMIIIPEGFEETISSGNRPELITVDAMESASALASVSDSSPGLSAVEACLRNMLASREGISDTKLELLDSPLSVTQHTVVADKSAEVSKSDVLNKIMMQNMILPIIVFVLIMMTSQMLISAISNEKIDKTLETLLSAPVSRTSVIGAKMLAAAAVALINAAVYMFGLSFFVSGAADDAAANITVPSAGDFPSVDDALAQLGLSLGVTDYILIGLQLFMTILICLSVSLILGAMANDTKSSQTMIMPMMFLAMIPYIISMLTDVNTLPMAVRILVYAIPFTHTFSSISNLMFGNTALFFGGLVYQIAVFAVCMFFALRIFKSDKIFTISLNLGQKSKFRKNSSKNQE